MIVTGGMTVPAWKYNYCTWQNDCFWKDDCTWKDDLYDGEDGLAEVQLVVHVGAGGGAPHGQHQLGLGPHHQVMVGVEHPLLIIQKLLVELLRFRVLLNRSTNV